MVVESLYIVWTLSKWVPNVRKELRDAHISYFYSKSQES